MKNQIIVVLGLAVDDKGNFLITQRYDPKVPKAHLKWQIPGGEVEFGEDPKDTLHREMIEEIGAEVKIVAPIPHIASTMWEIERQNVQVILFGYLVKIRSNQQINIENEETADYRWIRTKEIERYDRLPATDRFIFAAQKYLEKKKRDKVDKMAKGLFRKYKSAFIELANK
jgi:8-oxo-dGTP diphosphatase